MMALEFLWRVRLRRHRLVYRVEQQVQSVSGLHSRFRTGVYKHFSEPLWQSVGKTPPRRPKPGNPGSESI